MSTRERTAVVAPGIKHATVSLLDLDIEDQTALIAYLRSSGVLAAAEPVSCKKLEGGVSNRVVLVEPERSAPFVVKQALPKLRVRVDWFCPPERIRREASALTSLSRLAPAGTIPALLFEDHAHHLLAMEAVRQPHFNWKEMLLCGLLDSEHVRQFAQLLGSIHRESVDKSDELLEVFGDRSFFEALRLEPYYRFTALQVPEASGFFAELIADTLACRLVLVHGDYSPKNILVQNNRLVLLDHEVAHFGDPGFDVGFSMAHLLSKANHLREQRSLFTEAALQYWRTYSESLGPQRWQTDLEARAVRHTLACCLARVAGRSPLEYLSSEERLIQSRAVLELIINNMTKMEHLIPAFIDRLSCL